MILNYLFDRQIIKIIVHARRESVFVHRYYEIWSDIAHGATCKVFYKVRWTNSTATIHHHQFEFNLKFLTKLYSQQQNGTTSDRKFTTDLRLYFMNQELSINLHVNEIIAIENIVQLLAQGQTTIHPWSRFVALKCVRTMKRSLISVPPLLHEQLTQSSCIMTENLDAILIRNSAQFRQIMET